MQAVIAMFGIMPCCSHDSLWYTHVAGGELAGL